MGRLTAFMFLKCKPRNIIPMQPASSINKWYQFIVVCPVSFKHKRSNL